MRLDDHQALMIYRTAGLGLNADNNKGLIISQDDTVANPVCLELKNDGDGKTLLIVDRGEKTSVDIDTTTVTSTVMNISASNATGKVINIASGGVALDVLSTQADGSSVLNLVPGGASPGAFGVLRVDIVDGNIVMRLGNHYLWVDNTGKVRVHSLLPISDTDGTIVGTQS